jgi:MFS family permease
MTGDATPAKASQSKTPLDRLRRRAGRRGAGGSVDRSKLAFRGLVGVRTLGAFADSAMLPFVVLWARRDVGLSGAMAGLLFLAQALGELAGGLAGGALADRLGHRRVLLVSTAGMAVGYGSLFAVRQPVVALSAFFIAGLFESAFHPTIGALVGDLRAGPELPRAYAMVRVGANVGRIGGPLIGAAAVVVSLHAVFAVVAALLVAALVVTAVTVPPDRDLTEAPGEVEPDARPSALSALLHDRRLGLLVVSGGLLAITFTWWEADGLVLLRELRALGTTSYAALFAIAAAATVVLQMPASRLAHRLSPSRLLPLGACVQAVGMIALAAATLGYVVLIIAVIVIALGQMLYYPTVSTFVSRRAPRGGVATYQAALSTTEDIGTAIGPSTGLVLGGLGGPRLIWLLAGPICLLAGLGSVRATSNYPA